jgi:hypothetical protein
VVIHLSDFASWLNMRLAFIDLNISSPCTLFDHGELIDKRAYTLETLELIAEYERIWQARAHERAHETDTVG